MAVNRGVIRVSVELIHSLLHLPNDMRVVNFGIDQYGQHFIVVVDAEGIPASEPGCEPYQLTPTYQRDEEGRVTLMACRRARRMASSERG